MLLIVIGIIGFFVTILCTEILQNELKKCTQKKAKGQLRRNKCCQDLSQQKLHLGVQDTMFAIPITKLDIGTVTLRETGTQTPPSYQECGNENEKERQISFTD